MSFFISYMISPQRPTHLTSQLSVLISPINEPRTGALLFKKKSELRQWYDFMELSYGQL